jgi:RNA polymerase sigma-70 factor (ECF subfamily)
MPVHSDLENSLFKQLSQSDEKAFELLFKLYYAELCHYARTFVRDNDLARDIVQDTFMRIWEKKEQIRIHTSWRVYIYRSVHNHAINYLSKNQTWKQRQQEIAEEIRYQHELATRYLEEEAIDKAASEDIHHRLQAALRDLPDQCRTIFLMSRRQDLSYPQIAEQLHISINTVKTQMKRALQKLREALKQ